MYRIYEDEKHHLGLISDDGKHKTPAVYDEIQILEGDYWLCRAYCNWDYFYPATGEFALKRRESKMKYGKMATNMGEPTSLGDRELFDSIKPRVEDGYIYVYERGKYGINRLDGSVILDSLYDDLYVWRNANVIQVRLGNLHMYFNDKGQQILTDTPSYTEKSTPYFSGLGWTGVQIREIVEEWVDNHTYESSVGLVRILHEDKFTVAEFLSKNCERIPVDTKAIDLLTDRWSYEFGVNIVRIKADDKGCISEEEWMKGVRTLDGLGSFKNSWHYIDKFMSNSKTLISLKSLYWLKHKYDMDYHVIGALCFAYGIDESLEDGEVKWIHLEHYNEHCFPEDYGVSNVAEYGTLEELKELIEAHDWEAQGDPYGGAFFSFYNIRNPEREWEETERVLNYMYELGHDPRKLIEMVVSHLDSWDIKEEISYLENCTDWALTKCEFPNKLRDGKTLYDEYLGINNSNESEDIQNRTRILGEKFLAHGALTGEQLFEIETKRINELPNYHDYRHISEIFK